MDNKLNYKLINILISLLIVLVVYNMRTLIMGIFSFVFNIISPILISVMISYVLNLYLKKLNKFFNKYVSVLIFIFSILLFLYVLVFKLSSVMIEQFKSFISIFIYVVKDLSIKYDINVSGLLDYLSNFNVFLIVGNVFNYITFLMITISISIYMFFDFNKYTKFFKRSHYLILINEEIEKYTSSFFILVIINVIEYSLIFLIMGHPNYLFLGVMAGVMSLIPIIGGMITNGMALITSFVINYRLFVRTIIGILILTILDGYIISPLVYSRSNKISPLLTIISIYIGSKLFGVIGSILALPILIVGISIYKNLTNDNI